MLFSASITVPMALREKTSDRLSARWEGQGAALTVKPKDLCQGRQKVPTAVGTAGEKPQPGWQA